MSNSFFLPKPAPPSSTAENTMSTNVTTAKDGGMCPSDVPIPPVASVPPPDNVPSCCREHCLFKRKENTRLRKKAPLKNGSAPLCPNLIHEGCYQNLVLWGRNDEDDDDRDILAHFDPQDCDRELVVCDRSCYFKAREIKKMNSAGVGAAAKCNAWAMDGKNGPNDPVNSQSILLQWLQKPENFKRLIVRSTQEPRQAIYDDIAAYINSHEGLCTKRTGPEVRKRVNAWMLDYYDAEIFVQHELDIHEKQDARTLNQEILSRCSVYYELLDARRATEDLRTGRWICAKREAPGTAAMTGVEKNGNEKRKESTLLEEETSDGNYCKRPRTSAMDL